MTNRNPKPYPTIYDTDIALPERFTPIAWRARNSPRIDVKLGWHLLPDAMMTIEDARGWEAKGYLTMANRHGEDRVFLEIKRRSNPPDRSMPMSRRVRY